MSRTVATTMLLACAGCSQLFGLDDPVHATPSDAAVKDDAWKDDAWSGDDAATLEDAQSPDAKLDAPVSSAAPFVRQIAVSGAKVMSGPHANFPLLVATTQTWLRRTTNGGDVASASGFDIYFSADQAGASRLAHEVESYDGNTGALVAWIKIPSLTTTTSLYIHYGDASITASQEDRPGVWTGGYELVLHLTATTDSTTKNTMAPTNLGTNAGQSAGAATFNGTNSAIDAGSAAAIDGIFAGGGAVEGWIRPTSFGEAGFGRILDKDDAGGWLWMVDDGFYGNDVMGFQHSAIGENGRWRSPNSSIAMNTWQHLAVVYDSGSNNNTPQMYVNGAVVTVTTATQASGTIGSDATSVLVVGNDDVGSRTFEGSLDEIRMSSVSRTAGWFATQFQNQNDPSTFSTLSAPL